MTIESETEQKFSIDLNSLVKDHFCFLKHLHESNVTQNISLKSFEQYQWYWLPSNDSLSPDIAWLWHCHRLAPGKYRAYMNKFFANKKWEILPSYNPYQYHSNLSSFDLRQTLEESQEALDAATLDGFALLSSAKRQAELYWHLQPYFTDDGVPKFDTEVALKEYHQFLKLMKEHPDQTLVPTYLIDLYWHTHMTGGSVEDYATDCKKICGRFIDHDDEFGEGDRNGVLGEAFEATAKLWEKTYGDSTYKEKGGYRGPPPKDYFPNPLSNETAEVETDSKSLEKKAKEVESNDKKKVTENNSPRCGSSFTFPFRKVCVFILTVSFVVGVTSFILGNRLTSVEYACEGVAPSQADLDFRKAIDLSSPVCLTTSIRDEVMCLQAGINADELPRYCHTNIAEEQAGHRDWYLWWSPCTKCGTAWRMNPVVDHDKSFYKLPAEAPAELPLGTSSWQRWDPSRAAWRSGSVSIKECDSDSDANGIPSACYVEKRVNGLRTSGLILMIWIPALLIPALCWPYKLALVLVAVPLAIGVTCFTFGDNGLRTFGLVLMVAMLLLVVAMGCPLCLEPGSATGTGGRGNSGHYSGGGGGGCGGGGGGGGCGGGGGGCGGC